MGSHLLAIDGFVPHEGAESTVKQITDMIQQEAAGFKDLVRETATSVFGGDDCQIDADTPLGADPISVHLYVPEDQVQRVRDLVGDVLRGAKGQILRANSHDDPLEAISHPSSGDTRKCGNHGIVTRKPSYLETAEYGGQGHATAIV